MGNLYCTKEVSNSTPFINEKSAKAINEPKIAVATSTTTVESRSSVRSGQEAFLSSVTVSL